MSTFDGIWVPLVTPFRNGEIDIDAFQRLVDYYASAEVNGVFVAATTGEATSLSDDERDALIGAALGATDGRCNVGVGLCGANTASVMQDVRRLNRFSISTVLISAPYYVRPSQLGIRRHFEELAAVSDHPLIIYNIPYRTGVNIELATLRALAENPKFVAIKEAGNGNLDQLNGLIQQTPLRVLSGEDHLIYLTGCLGGHGAIAAAAHIRPHLYVRMWRHLAAGEMLAAREIWQKLAPLVKLLFSEPNPAPVKAALAMEGRIQEELRLPMTPASDGCRAALKAGLEALPG